MIFQTMERTAVDDVHNVLVAGDTPNDLQAGTKAGVRFVVGVLSGAHDHSSLGIIKHTHLLEDVTCIESLLDPREITQ
jgi:phosphoglycolate phosphatase-like HAD superfamily hydrolase